MIQGPLFSRQGPESNSMESDFHYTDIQLCTESGPRAWSLTPLLLDPAEWSWLSIIFRETLAVFQLINRLHSTLDSHTLRCLCSQNVLLLANKERKEIEKKNLVFQRKTKGFCVEVGVLEPAWAAGGECKNDCTTEALLLCWWGGQPPLLMALLGSVTVPV